MEYLLLLERGYEKKWFNLDNIEFVGYEKATVFYDYNFAVNMSNILKKFYNKYKIAIVRRGKDEQN